ncbi:hypothetical protein [Bathymodiolus japonicus methanotrophic gill symbiont]|uniref:hypothetical protein n=1 Tax=Bathymodiolus japonicus methanotrophic gill symbiont TaxID=113269 RepID=UPI001C8EB3DF|nr:hypothetical protein [Bathymodiolus japonicus methanotrophic gill symbiont]
MCSVCGGRRAAGASPIRCVGERITATGVPEFREVAWRACYIIFVDKFIDFCQKNHHYLSVIYMRQKYSKKSNVLYKNTKSVVPTGYFLKFQPIDL